MDAAIAVRGYAPPQLDDSATAGAADDVVWWVIWVGFAYAIALAWATYCRISGGYPDISLTWKGFKVACKSG